MPLCYKLIIIEILTTVVSAMISASMLASAQVYIISVPKHLCCKKRRVQELQVAVTINAN